MTDDVKVTKDISDRKAFREESLAVCGLLDKLSVEDQLITLINAICAICYAHEITSFEGSSNYATVTLKAKEEASG